MTALVDARPTRRVRLGLTAAPLDALSTVEWTEITDYVKTTSVKRGRNHELSRTDPGRVTLVLDNVDARFDPANTSSPYYPNLRPMRRLRITDDWGNLLSLDQSSIEREATASELGWTAVTNCTVDRSTADSVDGLASLAMTATTSAQTVASTPTGLDAIPITVGITYGGFGSFIAAGASRTAQIVLRWYDAAGAFLSDSTGSATALTSGVPVLVSHSAAAPASAAFVALRLVVNNAVIAQADLVDALAVVVGTSTTWRLGYAHRFTGYVPSFVPRWTGIGRSEITIEPTDALGAVLHAATMEESPWAIEVRADIDEAVAAGGKACWYRLGGSSLDSGGTNRHGVFQGSPAPASVPGLVAGSVAQATYFGRPDQQRLAIADKDLVTGFPFTIECWFRSLSDRSSYKQVLRADDGPQATNSSLSIAILGSSAIVSTEHGKLVVTLYRGSPLTKLSSITVDDGRVHHLVVTVTSVSAMKVWIDSVDVTAALSSPAGGFPVDLVTGYSIGNQIGLNGDYSFCTQPGDALDEVVIYDGLELDSARIAAHHTAGRTGWAGDHSGERLAKVLEHIVGWPTEDMAIDDGISIVADSMSGSTALDYAYNLETTEFGHLFVDGAGVITFYDRHRALLQGTTPVVTFGEGAGELAYEAPFAHGIDDADLWNEVQVSRSGGVTQIVKDATSRDEYGRRVLTRSGLALQADGDGIDMATWLLERYKDPVSRVREVRIKPQEDPLVTWPRVLGLELRDRVEVIAQPPGGGSSITQESHIEGITEDVNAKDWSITYRLSVVDDRSYWILGTSELGTGTRLGF